MHRPLSFTLGAILCITAITLGVYLAHDPMADMSFEQVADNLPTAVAQMSERADRMAYGAPAVVLLLGVGAVGIVLGFVRPSRQSYRQLR